METYGFSAAQWNAEKSEARDAMIKRARLRGTIAYSELVANIPSIQFEAHDVRMFDLLGQISTEENSNKRGLLSVVVVHKNGDMQPGPGFFELADELGRDTSDILVCWIKELKKVHAYWEKHG